MSAETQTAVVAETDEQEPVTGAAVEVDVDEAMPPVEVFELDFPESRIGGALAFAAVAALGLFLAAFATPTPVIIAGWLLVAFGVVAAARALGGDR